MPFNLAVVALLFSLLSFGSSKILAPGKQSAAFLGCYFVSYVHVGRGLVWCACIALVEAPGERPKSSSDVLPDEIGRAVGSHPGARKKILQAQKSKLHYLQADGVPRKQAHKQLKASGQQLARSPSRFPSQVLSKRYKITSQSSGPYPVSSSRSGRHVPLPRLPCFPRAPHT